MGCLYRFNCRKASTSSAIGCAAICSYMAVARTLCCHAARRRVGDSQDERSPHRVTLKTKWRSLEEGDRHLPYPQSAIAQRLSRIRHSQKTAISSGEGRSEKLTRIAVSRFQIIRRSLNITRRSILSRMLRCFRHR